MWCVWDVRCVRCVRCVVWCVMVYWWCEMCGKWVVVEMNEVNGFMCCMMCGKILDECVVFSVDVMFVKNV